MYARVPSFHSSIINCNSLKLDNNRLQSFVFSNYSESCFIVSQSKLKITIASGAKFRLANEEVISRKQIIPSRSLACISNHFSRVQRASRACPAKSLKETIGSRPFQKSPVSKSKSGFRGGKNIYETPDGKVGSRKKNSSRYILRPVYIRIHPWKLIPRVYAST